MRTTIAVLAFGLATAAGAQGVADLPDRPIARSEVAAVVKRQFAAMDSSRDGSVSAAEFDAYRQRQSANPDPGDNAFDHVGRRWFERADADQNGRVTRDEAMARPLRLFDMADADGNGVVSRQERQVAAMVMALGGN